MASRIKKVTDSVDSLKEKLNKRKSNVLDEKKDDDFFLVKNTQWDNGDESENSNETDNSSSSQDEDEEIDSSSDDDDNDEENLGGVNDGNGEKELTKDDKTENTDEYEYDSSDEEDIRNTIGNIPLEWYNDYPHIGYNLEGRKILKPAQGDALDEFLEKADDPNYWRTVKNKYTGQKVLLSDQDAQIIQRLQQSSHPTGSEDLYAPWVDFFSNEVRTMPVTGRPPDKRSFIPSNWERLRVGQMVHALKMGWMKPRGEIRKMKLSQDPNEPSLDLWKDDTEPEITQRYRMHIPAPKEILPGHAESYNPPEEYLFDEQEEAKWNEQEPEERRMNFKPKKFSSYRSVPKYALFTNERFSRLLDLYLAARQRKMKMNVNPEDLIPRRPDKKDLQPYPTREGMIYKGHTDVVTSISPDPSGQWLVSGSEDKTIKLWEVSTGRCMKTFNMEAKIKQVAWNPCPTMNLVAAVVGSDVILINPGLIDKLVCTNTDNTLNNYEAGPESDKSIVTWTCYGVHEKDAGLRIKVSHAYELDHFAWHHKGDYFATVQACGGKKSQAVLIHQISKRQSINPIINKIKGIAHRVSFHPVHPYFFVVTKNHVSIYNLMKQELIKTLQANCDQISSIDIHPGGDNLLIGSYETQLSWFDLDLSTKPYQTFKYHKSAVKQVAYHQHYPLFASASDDGAVIVSHGKVYSDQLLNSLIVTLKILRGHKITNGRGVLDCKFHTTQPWIFSAGADSTIRLFV